MVTIISVYEGGREYEWGPVVIYRDGKILPSWGIFNPQKRSMKKWLQQHTNKSHTLLVFKLSKIWD